MTILDSAASAALTTASYTAWFLVRYAAVVLGLYALSFVFARAGYLARFLASIISTIICASYGVVASIILSILGLRGCAQWTTARAYKWVMRLTTGIIFEVDDPKNYLGSTRPAVFITNHQSALDLTLLGAVFPKWCSQTAKASLKYYPFLGQFAWLSGGIFLDRGNAKDARQAMAGAAKNVLERRQSAFIFPEGTRLSGKEPALLPFKKGAFNLAVQAQIPIVAAVAANYSDICHWKTLTFKSGVIPVKVLDPIPTKGLTLDDVPRLATEVRELMLNEHIRLTAKVRGQPMPITASPETNGSTASSTVQPTASRRTRRAD